MQRIIKNNQIVDETWHLLPKETSFDELTNCDDYIVPLQLWRDHAHVLKARDGGLGVWLDSDEEAEEIGEDVQYFQVIALNFPAFTDGRSYSNARLLRDRYKFKGELRAIGDVLRDQLFFMAGRRAAKPQGLLGDLPGRHRRAAAAVPPPLTVPLQRTARLSAGFFVPGPWR